MSNLLFIYGTLDPQFAPDEISGVAAKLRPVSRGTMRGELYDFGEYPGAVRRSRSGTVSGRIVALPDDPEVLRKLDEYEGYDPRDPSRSLFVRTRHYVMMPNGARRLCWVYLYNGDPQSGRHLPAGKYRARRAGRPPARRAAS
jgi:gamma-glutamylcyclotransferase (GGCT)/AIG2-like uncharacterized protein YtfP